MKVDLAALADTMADYGLAYLLTVSDDHRPHAVSVQPVLRERALRIGAAGRRTLANLTARPDVTLLFPPSQPDGYSLIVDGRARLDGDLVSVEAAHAVLHRPADHAADRASASCGNDCVPLTG